MNSYNENLRNNVVSSLNDQEVELKKISASRDAAMFSLYYAEGARISAAEKLNVTWELYEEQQNVQNQAVLNNNIAVNLKDAADQEKTYVDQSVSNTAVGASNVQIATSAIVKLASDIGSIFTIANAADFDSQIYDQAKEALRYMNQTAYNAERASQLAMEASMYTSEVSAGTVADEAGATGAAMKTLLDTLTAQFNATAEAMSADNAALSQASDVEKKSEGQLEDINVEYFATSHAYQLNNKELNINLTVPPNSEKNQHMRSNTYYHVTFDRLKSPFPPTKKVAAGYPVDSYYIMLVKDEKKSTFSITSAEAIIQNDNKDQYIQLGPLPDATSESFKEKIYISQLLDSDGDEMELGENYVVFLYASLSEEYKKTLNNFDNFLSAQSNCFMLVNDLNAPKPKSITVGRVTEKERSVSFHLLQDKDYKVEYRLMFLPDSRHLVAGLLTADGLRSLEKEVEKLEKIADEYDPKINRLDGEISSLEAAITATDQQLEDDGLSEEEKEKIKKNRRELKKKLRLAKKRRNTLVKERHVLEKSIDPIKHHSKPGFFFNTLLAEQVPAGAYTKVDAKDITIEKKDGDILVKAKVKLEEDMTDNFGNALLDDVSYIPTVLAVSAEEAENQGQFASALSDFSKTTHFTYKSLKNTK